MISSIKKTLHKITPKWLVLFYHYLWPFFSAMVYAYPSDKMIIIGITGTKGKTSAAHFIRSVLSKSGKTGLISTSEICIDDTCTTNDMHMTMPGRAFIQKNLKKMLVAGCKYCVIETTSQGILLFRHKYINYDVAIFTNLSPEHLEAHNGFENYKKCKGKLFSELIKQHHKIIDGKRISKTIIANTDDDESQYFLSFNADKKVTYSIDSKSDYQATNLKSNSSGFAFDVGGNDYALNILGKFNIYNALPAIICGDLFDVRDIEIQDGISNVKTLLGRVQEVKIDKPFRVFVDYAHEGKSIKNILDMANEVSEGKVIVLVGSEGGGRDKSKRSIIGKTAMENADLVVLSSTDPYDEDPYMILDEVAKGAELVGGQRDKNLFIEVDRREGIKKALKLAEKGDVVIIAGKGSEVFMWVRGEKVPFNDLSVIKETAKEI